jgi:hypothetical protein
MQSPPTLGRWSTLWAIYDKKVDQVALRVAQVAQIGNKKRSADTS